MKSVIEFIQEDDPSYDPLAMALKKANVSKELWKGACNRVYFDGYYGPVSDAEWEEQDGREPYSVKESIQVIARVLAQVTEYYNSWENASYSEEDIRAALVPFYYEIYGERYPHVSMH